MVKADPVHPDLRDHEGTPGLLVCIQNCIISNYFIQFLNQSSSINKIVCINLPIIGPKGLDGIDGPPGYPGPKGNTGGQGNCSLYFMSLNISIDILKQMQIILKILNDIGQPGSVGPEGIPGEKGVKGEPGLTGMYTYFEIVN